MKIRLGIPMFLLGATLALGFAYGMGKVATAVANFQKSRVITVKGYAEKAIAADKASWEFSVSVTNLDLAAASTKLDADVAAVRAHLAQAAPLPADALTVFPVSVSVVNKKNDKGNSTNEVDYYLLRQSFRVASPDVRRIEAMANGLNPLLARGIFVQSYAPEYISAEIDRHKKDLLAEATRNGRERANILAENSGGTLGGLVDASQGVFQIVPLDSTRVSDYGVYDTSTIDKAVKAVVTLSFAVE
jgi:hypothetical protein